MYTSQSPLLWLVNNIICFFIILQHGENKSFIDFKQINHGMNDFYHLLTLVQSNNCHIFICLSISSYCYYGHMISRHVKLRTLMVSIVYFDVQCYQLATHKTLLVRNICILLAELITVLDILIP